jgi:hypothetical protein
MILHDIYTDKDITILDLYNEFIEFKKDDPFNHAENFTTEFFEILMSTINGRNDIDIMGYTAKELSNIIIKIGCKINAFDILN